MNAGTLTSACRCGSSIADSCRLPLQAAHARVPSLLRTSRSMVMIRHMCTSPCSNTSVVGPPSDHTPRHPREPPTRQRGRAARRLTLALMPPPAAGVTPGLPESPGARAGPRRRPLRPAARPPPARPAGAGGCPSTPGCARRRPPCTPAGGHTRCRRAPPCLLVLPAPLFYAQITQQGHAAQQAYARAVRCEAGDGQGSHAPGSASATRCHAPDVQPAAFQPSPSLIMQCQSASAVPWGAPW